MKLDVRYNGAGSGDWCEMVLDGKPVFEGHPSWSPAAVVALMLAVRPDLEVNLNETLTDEDML